MSPGKVRCPGEIIGNSPARDQNAFDSPYLRRLVVRSMLAVASALVFAATAVAVTPVHAAPPENQWSVGGHDLRNSRSNPREHIVNPRTVDNLSTKWTSTTRGDVSATPAVVNGAVYFPDWG